MQRDSRAKATVVLPPAAAKRLIARGVAALPQVRRALEQGLVVVTLGTTNAYVAEELTGRRVDPASHCAGYVGRTLSVVPEARRGRELVLEQGRPVELSPEEVLARLKAGDVIIKGGNVLDPEGVCGVFMASGTGGTVGRYVAAALARGVEIVIPISKLKSVHRRVVDLARELGAQRVRATGLSVGLYPLVGTVVTETEATALLYGVEATHIASGGVGAGEGAVVLLLSGEEEKVDRAFQELAALAREEPPLSFDAYDR
ncbi:MAG: Uncharacterized protein XD60_0363 [Acetothermia bacterium 64_32]|nr:MAG: Uncharacterized protein XD60_0363 [Acetothermia bacterium 64_32]